MLRSERRYVAPGDFVGIDNDSVFLEMIASVIDTEGARWGIGEIIGLEAKKIAVRIRRIANGDWQGVVPRGRDL